VPVAVGGTFAPFPFAPAGRGAPGAAAGRTGTLLAGTPPAVGGALAPTVGAFIDVTFGFCAAAPGDWWVA
jgi:hypothetical protein